MCGRFALAIPRSAIRHRFDLETAPDAPERYNIAPGQPVEAVLQDHLGRRMALFVWGLVPRFRRAGSKPAPLINARAETAAEKPTFRNALRFSRCLVPLQGFYEWSGPPGARRPWFVTSKNGELLAMAALHESFGAADGEAEARLAVLTCPANDLVAPIHNRMPVLVRPQDDARWLDPDLTDPSALADILASRPWPDMTAWPVSAAVNAVANQGPHLMAPVRADNLPLPGLAPRR
ncbi:SOS response-associated peptidase [Fundidesulfovibrio butyratiphilus]